MATYYTDEKNAQIIIALLKKNDIKKVVASPGATNVTFVAPGDATTFFISFFLRRAIIICAFFSSV